MGSIIGGVNPFEDTDIKLEDQPHPEDQEVGANSANRTNYTNLHYLRCCCTLTSYFTQDRSVEANVDPCDLER